MVYQWRVQGLFDVDAQTAGEELDRIYQEHGTLDPAQIVDESRDEGAPLHSCFEWDDNVAAEKYRQAQAGNIIRAIVTVTPSKDMAQDVIVRAFPCVASSYQPITVVVNDEEKLAMLRLDAIRELKAFRRKYEIISELRPVFSAIDSIDALSA